MDKIFYYIGITVVSLFTSLGFMYVLLTLLEITIEKVSTQITLIWSIMEYFTYRKEFKAWLLKKKQRSVMLEDEVLN